VQLLLLSGGQSVGAIGNLLLSESLVWLSSWLVSHQVIFAEVPHKIICMTLCYPPVKQHIVCLNHNCIYQPLRSEQTSELLQMAFQF
jgi:hypothetical protein